MLTLDTLRNFDPKAPEPLGAARWRKCCPQCGLEKPLDQAHRSLDIDSQKLVYICRRCGITGRIGGQVYRSEIDRAKLQQAAIEEDRRKRKLAFSIALQSLQDTPGADYLAGRGIPLSLARKSDVKYSRWFAGRAAVVFLLRDANGRVRARQGRYIDGREPRMRTMGKVTQGVFSTPGAWGDVLTITEAPIDALSLHLIGIPAIATCGTTLPAFVAEKAAGRVVMIATDADKAGDKAFEVWRSMLRKAAVVDRLRPEDAKDWNEIIKAHHS